MSIASSRKGENAMLEEPQHLTATTKWDRVFWAAVVAIVLAMVLAPAIAPQAKFAPAIQAATVENKRRRFRGIPPPADFDLDTLPPTALLSPREVAAILRVAIGTVDSWRTRPNHPLRFIWLQGHVRYTAKDLRAYIALPGGKPRGPGRPRRQDPSVNNQEITAN